ncbi:hypothetical protein MNBD_ALPHA02-1359 [hydrothermal vent metagenome]|uniref:Uncharacterized protein n=1 Tax=hydrothermal vent metagenome TaxID=652676 RepID=A0A3B0SIF9_9ZZZZ
MKSLLYITILISLLSSAAYAGESDAAKYRKCMALTESDPPAAISYANDWIFSGGAQIPAGHCKALGLLGAGKAKDAATLLEKLVEDMVIYGDGDPAQARRNEDLKVQLYGQAALAWEQAGELDKAYVAYSAALTSIRTNVLRDERDLFHELYLARGRLQIARGQYKAAIEDFTLAIEKDSRRFEGFLQRAKAFRKRKSFLKARLDLRIAFKRAPEHPAILLESGILYRMQGKTFEARLDWQKIIDHYPKSEYAKLARTNIELLKSQL